MRTLAYCTSFCPTPEMWESRYALWVRSLRHSGLKFDQILIADDASPHVPDWPDAEIVHQRDAPRPADVRSEAPILIYRHDQRRGRNSMYDFPGWHRSFAFGALYAEAQGFGRVVHVESDAHVISRCLAERINHTDAGWWTPWSRKYWIQEMALQVAAGEQVAEMAAFARRPYADLIGRVHENQLPYTHVERLYRGDRHGELLDHVPLGADFATQVLIGRPASYYWWLEADATGIAPTAPASSDEVRIGFAELQNAAIFECDWSTPEADHRWMTEFDSQIRLPSVAQQPCVLQLELLVFLAAPERTSQRLLVLMNERVIGDVEMFRACRLYCDVPADALHPDGPNMVRLIHPDATPVTAVFPEAIDSRRLSFALCGLRLSPA